MKTTIPARASPPRPARGSFARAAAAAVDALALRWALLPPLAMALGAAGYMTAATEPGWLLLAVAAAGPATLAALAGRRLGGWPAFFFWCAFAAGLGALAGKARAELVRAPVLVAEIGPVRVEGVVVEIDAGARSQRLRLRVHAIEGVPAAMTPAYVRLAHAQAITVGPGRAASCLAILSPPPAPVTPGDYAFNRDAWFQQLGGVGFALGACSPMAVQPLATPSQRVQRWFGAARRDIAAHVAAIAGPDGGGMAAALVTGDRSHISPSDAEALQLSGLAHLLSISGVHMVLVGGVCFAAVRWTWPLIEPLALRAPAVKAAALAALIGCTAYFSISGGEVATQRAYVMALVAFGAKLVDRPALSIRSLAIALALVVATQPESVVAPGFQMSFAASAALIALYEIWPRAGQPAGEGTLGRAAGWLIGTTVSSLTASAATLPFAVHHFERTAALSVVANLLSTPIMTFWTTPAAIIAALAAPLGLSGPPLVAMGESAALIMDIARWVAARDPDLDPPRLGGWALACASAGICLACALKGPLRLLALIPFAAFAALWATGGAPTVHVARDGAVYARTADAWTRIDVWRGERGLRPLAVEGEVRAAPPCAEPCALELEGGALEWRAPPPPAAASPDAAPEPAPEAADCPAQPLVVRHAAGGALTLSPCALAQAGGASIDRLPKGFRLRVARSDAARPWAAR